MEEAKWAKRCNEICYWYECSNCRGEVPRSPWGSHWFSAYCPSCGFPMGAEIEGDDEDEDLG